MKNVTKGVGLVIVALLGLGGCLSDPRGVSFDPQITDAADVADIAETPQGDVSQNGDSNIADGGEGVPVDGGSSSDTSDLRDTASPGDADSLPDATPACGSDDDCALEDPCHEGRCAGGVCVVGAAATGTKCELSESDWGICHEGSCIDCAPSQGAGLCAQPLVCSQISLCEAPALIFSNPEKLQGLSGAELDSCGFVSHLGNHYALCSKLNNYGKLQPHVYTSTDGTNWTLKGSMVPLPAGIRETSEYTITNAYDQYHVHQRDYPIVLDDGTFMAAAAGYFHWANGNEWLNFAAYWHSNDFLSWDGYRGTSEYGDQFLIALGTEWSDFARNVGVTSPTLGQQPDGSFVAYVQQAPHRNALDAAEHSRFYRRFTGSLLSQGPAGGISWTYDENFTFDRLDYDAAHGRFFYINPGHVGYFHRRDEPDARSCSNVSTNHWAHSTTGEGGSFTDKGASPEVRVMTSCDTYLDPCAIQAPFFASLGGRLAMYYRLMTNSNTGEWVGEGWYRVMARFQVESCTEH